MSADRRADCRRRLDLDLLAYRGSVPNRYSGPVLGSVHDVLYQLPRVTTARCSAPPLTWREAGARMFSVARKLADAASRRGRRRRRLRAPVPARQALRQTEVRHRRRWTSRGATVAVVEQTALAKPVLPAAALHAPQRRRRRRSRALAAINRRCWWWRRCPVITPRCCARRCATLLARPHRLRHRLARRAPGARSTRARSRSTTTSATCARSSGTSARSGCTSLSVCQAAVPALAAVALTRGRRRARAAQPDPDGRADRHAPQPDPGQPLRHQQAAALVRDPPAARGAGGVSGARPARLSRVPAARGLRRHEPGAARCVALGLLPGRDERRRGSAPRSTAGFYDEYNAVLDMPAEYYLDCVRVVFQQHLLPRGLWQVAGRAGHAGGGVERRADDRRGRAGRHLRPGSDARRPRAVHRHPRRPQAPPDRQGRRPLRHLQRPALARDRVAAAARLHRRGRSHVAAAPAPRTA